VSAFFELVESGAISKVMASPWVTGIHFPKLTDWAELWPFVTVDCQSNWPFF